MSELDFGQLNPFKSVAELVLSEREERLALAGKGLCFGVESVDQASGMWPGDFVVWVSETGAGKTASATKASVANALNGKRVHTFFLEAKRFEPVQRIKYQTAMRLRTDEPFVSFREWMTGKEPKGFEGLDQKANEELQKLNTLAIYQNERGLTVDRFVSIVTSIKSETDLVVVDFAQHFDYGEDPEHLALKKIARTCRELALDYSIPVLLVSQIRKRDLKLNTLIPTYHDIHGSSEIAKSANTIICMGPVGTPSGNTRHTMFHVAKSRLDSSVTIYGMIQTFDYRLNDYHPGYYIGRLKGYGTEFDQIKRREDAPYWAKSALFGDEYEVKL